MQTTVPSTTAQENDRDTRLQTHDVFWPCRQWSVETGIIRWLQTHHSPWLYRLACQSYQRTSDLMATSHRCLFPTFHQRSSKVIKGHQNSSKVIKIHQRSSKLIKGLKFRRKPIKGLVFAEPPWERPPASWRSPGWSHRSGFCFTTTRKKISSVSGNRKQRKVGIKNRFGFNFVPLGMEGFKKSFSKFFFSSLRSSISKRDEEKNVPRYFFYRNKMGEKESALGQSGKWPVHAEEIKAT